VARLAASKWAVVTFGTLLLAGPAVSASGWGHRSRLPQDRTTSPPVHSVDLKWTASTSRVVGYNVYRSEKATGPYVRLTSAPVSRTDYTDRTVQAGRTYFYRVRAVDNKGHESSYSNQVKAVVPSP